MTTALVTDSNAQLPPLLRDRYGVLVVPLTVTLDGVDHREGVDLDDAAFYERLAAGAPVATAAPSPGAFLMAYEQAAAAGADEILSIHLGANVSATVSSATVAAGMSAVPVRVIDTGTASFAIGCCVWAAGAVLAGGGTASTAAEEAQRVAASIGNVFVVGALSLAERGGRLAAGAGTGDGVPVLALEDGRMRPVARASSRADAIEAMASYVERISAGAPQRIGVGDAAAPTLGAALAERLAALSIALEVVRYAVGPSVGAHTGAGTVGAVFYPVAGSPAT